jgi:ACS family D-galactonate transporter-like MFS transporter
MVEKGTAVTPSSTPRSRRWLPWPKRIDVALLAFTALVIAYCDRVNISVTAPSMMREYGWDTVGMGWVFSGFFAGYSLMMIPAGMLADRFGPKRVFGLSMVWWSALTAVTPLPRSLGALTAVRVLMGAGESGTFPSMNGILVRWFPRQEYSRVTGFCWSGGYAGSIVGIPFGSLILAKLGWRAVFLIFAAIGLAWAPLWQRAVADQPEQSTAIEDAELDYIRASRPEIRQAERVPWGRILRIPAFWALFSLHFSSNWFAYVMISWLPTYLLTAKGFSLSNMAVGATLPYICALLATNGFGMMIDRLSVGRDRTRVRKMFLIPYALSAVALVLVPLAPTPQTTVAMLCVAMAFLTSATPVYSSNSLDLAPRYAATVVGVQACIANLAGILAPVAIGYVARSGGWSMAFALTAAIIGGGIVSFGLFGSAERAID